MGECDYCAGARVAMFCVGYAPERFCGSVRHGGSPCIDRETIKTKQEEFESQLEPVLKGLINLSGTNQHGDWFCEVYFESQNVIMAIRQVISHASIPVKGSDFGGSTLSQEYCGYILRDITEYYLKSDIITKFIVEDGSVLNREIIGEVVKKHNHRIKVCAKKFIRIFKKKNYHAALEYLKKLDHLSGSAMNIEDSLGKSIAMQIEYELRRKPLLVLGK